MDRIGGAPTIPLDPPTAYGLASAFVLVGTPLVRAGRGRAAFWSAVGFILVFASSVQYFLFRWPAWMYSYLLPEENFSLAWVSPAFFLAVVGAGTVGAYVTLNLVRGGHMAWAVVNTLLGIGAWLLLWAVTWDAYFHLGTYETYHQGVAPHINDVPAFQNAMTASGVLYGVVAVPLLFWMIRSGVRAQSALRVQPDPAAPWRQRSGEVEPEAGSTPPGTVAERVAVARRAQREWASRPLRERVRRLRQVRHALLRSAEELATLLEEENGRPKGESYLSEIVPSADLFDWWLGEGKRFLQPRGVTLDPLLFPGKRGVIEATPRGVVAAIAPWNFPIMLPLRTLVPALLAGNAVVLKPSEHAPRSGAFLERLFAEALGPELVQVIQGGGEVGQQVIEAGVDFVVFIGSRATGTKVAQAAAESLTPVALELGAKDAAIVLEDADLSRSAAGIAWAAFANAGQNCAAIERCYVVDSVWDAFVAKLEEEVSRLRVGPGPEGEVDLGRLSTEYQQRIVDEQLAELRERGVATLTPAGPEGPVLALNPPEDLRICTEETFGPILPLFSVPEADTAVEAANRSPYGLTVSVWSKDLHRAERLGRRVHAGIVTVNNHAFTGALPQAPWGGVRASGHGVTNSPRMIEQLTVPRFVLVDRGLAKREQWWFPYDEARLRLARGVVRLRGPGPRLGALQDVIAGALSKRRA